MGLIDFQEVGDMVRQAVEVRVRTEPTRFAQELFSEMIGLIGLLVLRTHCRVRTLVADEDAQMARRGCWSASKELEDLTPKVAVLHKHLAELIQLEASTRRLEELARHRRLANNGATPE